MKLPIPFYHNGMRQDDDVVLVYDENNIFNSIDDLEKYIIEFYRNDDKSLTLKDYCNIKQNLEHYYDGIINTIDFIISPEKRVLKHFKINMNSYPLQIKNEWTNNFSTMRELIINNNNLKHEFIKNNKDIIINFINTKLLTILTEQEDKRKQVNKKYYNNTKEKIKQENEYIKSLLPVKEKHLLTEEEKIKHRQETNSKYYNKNKLEKQVNEL
jgi:hypothetical protein